jgi:ABC-type branched-subunit amino acid transport system ATPase component
VNDHEVILSVEGLTHRFGGVTAIDGCSLSVRRGLITGLIGPNGAGKSTLVGLVSGEIAVQRGRISFSNTDIRGWSPHRLAAAGLVRTFQVPRVFEGLTAVENMLVASQGQAGESLFNTLFRAKLVKAMERRAVGRALDLLEMFDLLDLRNAYAAELSGGQRRLLELARAMMLDPRLLLLDEPMSGINPILVERIGGYLREMRRTGVSLVVVEHNLDVVEELCDWVTVMVQGRALAGGSMDELRRHAGVVEAYLGAGRG